MFKRLFVVMRWFRRMPQVPAGIAGVLFALYAGQQALAIARVGALHQILQLEGDGGGALVFAVVCALAGVIATVRPFPAALLFAGAALIGAGVGALYQDFMLWFWSAGAAALAVVLVLCARTVRMHGRSMLS